MKTFQKFFIVAVLAAFPLVLSAQNKDNNTETVKYVTSISCSNCVNNIMTNLPQEKGVKDVKCDLATKEVTVTYQKNKNNPADLKKAIEKLGYTAKQETAENTVRDKK
ncbi:MAG: heavy metal-associated domain-containing protein [Bacteroidales bacterium]|jgi:copper chaperone CopZ